MEDAIVTAAGLITASGYGGRRRSFRKWDGRAEDSEALPAFQWSDLFETSCPRFGRMDPLCRMALASVELMEMDFGAMSDDARAGVGVCMGTPAGCVSVDVAFWRGRTGPGGASPALFTYTLPSTAAGEICIRHRVTGPNLCLMVDERDDGSVLREARDFLRRREAWGCVCVLCNAVDEASRAIIGGIAGAAAAESYAYALFVEREDCAGRDGRKVLARLSDGSGGKETAAGICGPAGGGRARGRKGARANAARGSRGVSRCGN